jgi:hypothetical protein
MSWQSVGQHTFVPTDKAVQVGSFDLAAGQDTIWVKITQLNNPGDWPWSYGILSWRNANGTPLGSVKAYSNRLGEVFRLGNGLPPSDGTGSIWFEPRGFNLGWLKAGFPWELKFEAQAGASDLTSGYWNRDPQSGVITPKTSGDNLDMTPGWIKAKNLIITDDSGSSEERSVPGYQQGSWIPTVGLGTVAPPPEATKWVRVGDLVTVYSELTNFSDQTSDFQVKVTGLPYPPAINAAVGACMASRVADAPSCVYVGSAAQDLRFFRNAANETNPWLALRHNDLGSSAIIMFSATYLTNDDSWTPGNSAQLTAKHFKRSNAGQI